MQRGHDVLVERLPDRAWLLGAIEDRDCTDGRRQRGKEMVDAEGAIELHRQHADPRRAA